MTFVRRAGSSVTHLVEVDGYPITTVCAARLYGHLDPLAGTLNCRACALIAAGRPKPKHRDLRTHFAQVFWTGLLGALVLTPPSLVEDEPYVAVGFVLVGSTLLVDRLLHGRFGR